MAHAGGGTTKLKTTQLKREGSLPALRSNCTSRDQYVIYESLYIELTQSNWGVPQNCPVSSNRKHEYVAS